MIKNDKKLKAVLIKLSVEDYNKFLKVNSYFQEKNQKKESFTETIKNVINLFCLEKLDC